MVGKYLFLAEKYSLALRMFEKITIDAISRETVTIIAKILQITGQGNCEEYMEMKKERAG